MELKQWPKEFGLACPLPPLPHFCFLSSRATFAFKEVTNAILILQVDISSQLMSHSVKNPPFPPLQSFLKFLMSCLFSYLTIFILTISKCSTSTAIGLHSLSTCRPWLTHLLCHLPLCFRFCPLLMINL